MSHFCPSLGPVSQRTEQKGQISASGAVAMAFWVGREPRASESLGLAPASVSLSRAGLGPAQPRTAPSSPGSYTAQSLTLPHTPPLPLPPPLSAPPPLFPPPSARLPLAPGPRPPAPAASRPSAPLPPPSASAPLGRPGQPRAPLAQ